MKFGNHSDSHPHVNGLTLEKNKEEIEKASAKIEKITKTKVSLYRAPYGEYNDTVIRAAEELKYKAIQWDIDSLDYKELTEAEMISRIIPKLKNGSIILMHNGAKNTATSLDKILTEIEKADYKVVPVSNLIYENNYTIDNNGTQHKNQN